MGLVTAWQEWASGTVAAGQVQRAWPARQPGKGPLCQTAGPMSRRGSRAQDLEHPRSQNRGGPLVQPLVRLSGHSQRRFQPSGESLFDGRRQRSQYLGD